MNVNDNDHLDGTHKASAVAKAIWALAHKPGYSPTIVFDGAIRGAAMALISTDLTLEDLAVLFEKGAQDFREAIEIGIRSNVQ